MKTEGTRRGRRGRRGREGEKRERGGGKEERKGEGPGKVYLGKIDGRRGGLCVGLFSPSLSVFINCMACRGLRHSTEGRRSRRASVQLSGIVC